MTIWMTGEGGMEGGKEGGKEGSRACVANDFISKG